MTPATEGCRAMRCASSTVSGALCRHGQLSSDPLQLLMAMGHFVTKNVVGPAAARLFSTPELMPCTAADMAVTTNTPTATPRMVSAARTLLERIASKAMKTPSLRMCSRSLTVMLFRPQCGDGIETRRAARGIQSGRDADTGAQHDGHDHGPERHAGWQRRQCGNGARQAEAQANAQRGAHGAERGGFHEKLGENVATPRAQRLPDTDLARPLRHGHQHDVHDDNRADDEPDGRKHHARFHQDALDDLPLGERTRRAFEHEIIR